MKRIIVCLIIGVVSAGCLAHAQKGNSNMKPGNGNLQKSSSQKMASQSKLYEVCGNPNISCESAASFQPHELPVSISGELEWFGEYKSKPFYAIVLKSRKVIPDTDGGDGEDCGGQFTEDERTEVQNLFPDNKAFASEFGCYHFQISYTNVNSDYNLLAIYAGGSKAAANSLLRKVRDTGKFPGANIRKMQVILCYGCH